MTHTAGANLNRTSIDDVTEEKSEYTLASRAMKKLRESLKSAAEEKGYNLEVQIVYKSREQEPRDMERQLQVSAWPLENRGALIHPSHIHAMIQGFVPGESYQKFHVEILIAEPPVLKQLGYELGPAYHDNVTPLRRE